MFCKLVPKHACTRPMERRGIERLSPPLPPFQCCRRPRVASAENTVYFSDRHPLPTSANTTLKRGEWGETWTVSRAFGRPIAWSFHDQALFIFPTPDHLHLVISFYQVLVPTYIYTNARMVLYIWASVYLFACMSIHLRSYISTYQCVHTVCRYLYASLQLDIYLYIYMPRYDPHISICLYVHIWHIQMSTSTTLTV